MIARDFSRPEYRLGPVQRQVVTALRSGALTLEALARRLGVPPSTLRQYALAGLAARGIVAADRDGTFSLVGRG